MDIRNINTAIAVDIGLEEAVLVAILFHGNKFNLSIEDNSLTVGASEKQISDELEFWTPRQVSRIIVNLEKNGVIRSKQKDSLNRTKFYQLTNKY